MYKMEWLWVAGVPEDNNLSSLALDVVALLQIDLVHGLSILLNLQLLLEEQEANCGRWAFAHLQVVCQLHPYLDLEPPFTVIYALVIFKLTTIICFTWSKTPENHSKTPTGVECSYVGSKWC